MADDPRHLLSGMLFPSWHLFPKIFHTLIFLSIAYWCASRSAAALYLVAVLRGFWRVTT
jgi:hypothetical protein